MKRRLFCLIGLIAIGSLWIASSVYDEHPTTEEIWVCQPDVEGPGFCSWITAEDLDARPWYAKMFHQYILVSLILAGAFVIGIIAPADRKKIPPKNWGELWYAQNIEPCTICHHPMMDIIGAEGHNRYYRCPECKAEKTTKQKEFVKGKIGTILQNAASLSEPPISKPPISQIKEKHAEQPEIEAVKIDTPKIESVPCPICGSQTNVRTVKKGPDTGKQFHVCTKFPKCKGRVQVHRKAL